MIVTGTAPASLGVLKSKTCLEFVELAGNLCRRLGLPRSLGQIYGLVYLAPRPLSLDEIADGLSISKASVSTGTRQLAGWGAVRQVWVPGERRDYFEAVPELGRILREAYENIFKARLTASKALCDELLVRLASNGEERELPEDERQHVIGRIRSLSRLQERLQTISTWLEKLL